MTGQPSSVIWLPYTLVITFHVSLSSVILTIDRKPLGQQTPMTTDKDTSCYWPLYLHWHWSITSQETMWQTCFPKRQWACDWIFLKKKDQILFTIIIILMIQSSHIFAHVMAWQPADRSCHGMCSHVTWSDHNFSIKINMKLFKIKIISLETLCNIVFWNCMIA